MVVDKLVQAARQHMGQALSNFQEELSKVRTGRAHAGLVESVRVDYYGSETPLKNVATITVSDARTIQIMPWEKHLIKTIEKAIAKADLGLNPVSEADLVRITIPPLTQERRLDLVKVVKNLAESAKVAVRAARRDAMDALKTALKAKEIDEDSERRTRDVIQKLTDQQIADIERLAEVKAKELLET